jgi:hypothetical protein
MENLENLEFSWNLQMGKKPGILMEFYVEF